jgi:hypothetical protein
MTKKSFESELLTLPLIFENRLFTIPDYQRGYTWEEKQVEELLKDIDHLMNDGVAHRHYTGTLVLIQPNATDEDEFHLIDGQQRMTTLVILMRMLREHLPEADRPAFDVLYLRRGEHGNDRSVLRLNSDTHSFFKQVVLGDGNVANEPATLEAHKRLLASRELISKWLEDRLHSGVTILNIRNTIETELGFLVYTPKDDAETGIMFEVINNRGKPLSELEKVKNYLIYCCVKLSAKTLRSSINDDWSGILRNLNTAKKTSPSDEGAFLRYCVAVHFKLNKTDSQYGYDELKKQMTIDTALKNRESVVQIISDFVRFLKTAAFWYARLYGQHHEGLDHDLCTVLNQIRAQEQQASIMPLFLALVIKLHGRDNHVLVRLLEQLEILNFRVYMARNMTARNDTGQGDLYRYASQYYHDELLAEFADEDKSIKSQENALEYSLVSFVLLHAADGRFKKSFVLDEDSPDDFYKWSGLRYFLMNYEAKLQPTKTIPIDKILLARKDGKPSDYLSVEHLWAVENRNTGGKNNRKIDKFEKRRLGNFVLLELRLNIKGGKDDLEKKLKLYLGESGDEPPTDLEQVRKMAKYVDEDLLKNPQDKKKSKSKNYFRDFYRNLNKHQEECYVDFATERWSVERFLGYKKFIKDNNVDEGTKMNL